MFSRFVPYLNIYNVWPIPVKRADVKFPHHHPSSQTIHANHSTHLPNEHFRPCNQSSCSTSRSFRGDGGMQVYIRPKPKRILIIIDVRIYFSILNTHTSAYYTENPLTVWYKSCKCFNDISNMGSNIKEFKCIFSGVIIATNSSVFIAPSLI